MRDLESVSLVKLPSVPLLDRSKLPRVKCVYFVLNERGKPLYIGQTCDLKMRWANHKCNRLFAGTRRIKIAWLIMNGPKMRDCAETCFIEMYSPALNCSTNGGGTFTKEYWQKLWSRAESARIARKRNASILTARKRPKPGRPKKGRTNGR